MYGYIRPRGDLLSADAVSLYRALTCGVCRAERRATGQFSALQLRHESVFLALCRAVCEKKRFTIVRHRCPLHPFRSRPMAEENTAVIYAAEAAAVLEWLRAADGLRDERGLSRLPALLRMPALSRRLRRADEKALTAELTALTDELREAEAAAIPSVDIPAAVSGKIVALLFSATCEKESAALLYPIGEHLGRFVYILDALDDFREDAKKKRYNPYSLLYKFDEIDRLAEDAESSLGAELAALGEATRALPFDNLPEAEPLIRNITEEGLSARAQAVLQKYRKEKAE